MKPLQLSIPPVKEKRLLTRGEILMTNGVYANPRYPKSRYVVSDGECYIFGDSNPLYKSANYALNTEEYIKVDERIVFLPCD